MFLRFLILIVLCSFATSAYSITVHDAGYGFKYRVAADGTATNGTPVSEFGSFAEVLGDLAVESVSEVATAVQESGFGQNSFAINNYAEVRGNLSTGEIGVATGIPSDNASSGNAAIELFDRVFIDLTSQPSSILSVINVGINIDGTLGDFLGGSQLNYGFNVIAQPIFNNEFVPGDSVISSNQIFSDGEFSNTGNAELLNGDPFKLRGSIELQGGSEYELIVSQFLLGIGQTSFLGTSSFIFDTDLAFTSASGTFLSANLTSVAAVPLPPAGALMVPFLMFLLFRRKNSLH